MAWDQEQTTELNKTFALLTNKTERLGHQTLYTLALNVKAQSLKIKKTDVVDVVKNSAVVLVTKVKSAFLA